MQINATFESFEEMEEFAKKMAGGEMPKCKQEKKEELKKEEAKEQKTSPVEEPVDQQPDPEPAQEEEVPTEPETVAYTLVNVRTKLGALTKAGKKAQVQELIKSFGVDKLSQIPEDKYQEVMQKAGEL